VVRFPGICMGRLAQLVEHPAHIVQRISYPFPLNRRNRAVIGSIPIMPITMDDQEIRQLYEDVWAHCGHKRQIDIFIEEMSELTKAFLKARREGKTFDKEVYKELADVKICFDQTMHRLEDRGKENKVFKEITHKQERLKKRLIEKTL
jgi:hypothetical protein